MRLLTFRTAPGTTQVARLTDTGMVQPLAYGNGAAVDSLIALITSGETVATLKDYGPALAWDAVRLLAPIPRPARNIFCVGKNYRNHAQEFTLSGFDTGQTTADAIPTDPIVFSKLPETVVAHGDTVWDAANVSHALDYEAELALIIGKRGRAINKADALAHVWGYTILNDITARDWQKRHKQWHLGKSFDTFAPMGPVAITADDLDATNLDIRCWINGELRQNANTRDLIFDIPTLIATISTGITLQPGDIIATGTPEGVGIGFQPPRFLKRGDTMTIEISGIGRLENTIGEVIA